MNKYFVSCAVAIAMLSTDAIAQSSYPAKPVRIVVPSSAGGGADIIARNIRAETGKWAKVVKAAGIRQE